MKLHVGSSDVHLRPATRRLLRRIVSAQVGLSPSFGFLLRSALEPKIAVAAGDLAGVHVLTGHAIPGVHHISGSGTTYEGAVIAVLAETIERYAQYMAPFANRHKLIFASYRAMVGHSRVLVPGDLRFFTDAQLAQPGFPFLPLGTDCVIGWARARSLLNDRVCWMPAQLAYVGYPMPMHEPRFMLGVSTGTAAHTTRDQALRNAVLELIQTDAAMGNWYGARSPIPIELGTSARTQIVEQTLQRHLGLHGPTFRFFWLPSADLPAFPLACIMEGSRAPLRAVGLGCDLRLDRAMYKAFLEAVAVAKLAKATIVRHKLGADSAANDPTKMYDLDSNVAHYAVGGHTEFESKFPSFDAGICPDDVPPDVDFGIVGDLRYLANGFDHTGKELVFLDLTTSDIVALGFHVMRAWSPDTLTLSLPAAPPLAHGRFLAYGGIGNTSPHPYP